MGFSKKVVSIGNVKIGGDNPIAIQSMTNTKTEDYAACINQILELEEVGCEIIRVAVPNEKAAKAVSKIKEKIHIPLVCDIHFDYKLALLSVDNGADKIRINPGNIGGEDRIKAVVEACKGSNIPIRIGVNSGSLKKEQLEKYGKVTASGLFESALNETKLLEQFDYDNIVISIKASNPIMCRDSYSLYAKERDYPLHIGITEAGGLLGGSIKSAIGLSKILEGGMGDTIRVSLTSDPKDEIIAAKYILSSLGLRDMACVVSCPTCGRTEIDMIPIAKRVEEYASKLNKNIKIAVMGCVVNGPGEAKEADIGICGGVGCGLIIKRGEVIKKVPEDKLLDELFFEIEKL